MSLPLHHFVWFRRAMQQYMPEDNERTGHIDFLLSVLELRIRGSMHESLTPTRDIRMEPHSRERQETRATTVRDSSRALQPGLIRISNGSIETTSTSYVSRQSPPLRKRSGWYLSSPHPLSWTHVKRTKYR